MDATQIAALIVGSGGVGALLLKAVEQLGPLLVGRGARRRDELERAWAARDREARKRRQIEEFAARLVRRLIEAPCVPADEIPEWPPYSGTGPTKTKE